MHIFKNEKEKKNQRSSTVCLCSCWVPVKARLSSLSHSRSHELRVDRRVKSLESFLTPPPILRLKHRKRQSTICLPWVWANAQSCGPQSTQNIYILENPLIISCPQQTASWLLSPGLAHSELHTDRTVCIYSCVAGGFYVAQCPLDSPVLHVSVGGSSLLPHSANPSSYPWTSALLHY